MVFFECNISYNDGIWMKFKCSWERERERELLIIWNGISITVAENLIFWLILMEIYYEGLFKV